MEENRPPAGRTGLPRPMSRLPPPKSTNVPMRRAPSRDSLHGQATAAPTASEPNPSRLRTVASRDRLARGSVFGLNNISNIASPPTTANSTPAASVSTTAKTVSRARPVSSLPTIHSQPAIPKSSTVGNGFSRLPRDPAMTALPEQDPAPDRQTCSKLPGLRKRPSSQWISQETLTRNRTPSITNLSSGGTSYGSHSQQSSLDGNVLGSEPKRAGASTLQPSLAERTVETLSQLSPSPALKTRASKSNFFDSETFGVTPRPASRRDSRPASSRRSESSTRSSQQPSLSRPGSSSGTGNEVTTGTSFRSQLPPIDDPNVRGRTMRSLTKTPSKMDLNGSVRDKTTFSSTTVRLSRSRTPSLGQMNHDLTSPLGSKTTTARPLPPRPSVNGVFKKPAAAGTKKVDTPALPLRTGSVNSQKSSTTASGEEATFSGASTTSTQTVASGQESPQFKKSSAALREQIAKAKAAKRAAAQSTPAQSRTAQTIQNGDMPVIPTDNTFDFGLADDPFNLKRDASSTSKVLQTRVATARTSGRLNIAALGLKEIPAEVLDMYSFENSGGSWAESVDLTRFVAADNELEMIDEKLFPDVDPEDLAEDEDAPICMFGGLETLDLHGNMLISLPAGLRRLTLLTSLNLASNRLANNCLEIVCQITPLRDLKIGGNLLWGTLEPCFSRLVNLEILDLHGNNLQQLPARFGELHRLRILNLAENSFESLPFDVLSKLPLTELNVRKNRLSGALIGDDVEILPALQNLDVSSNQLTSLARPNSGLSMPALTQLCVSMNRIQALPDISSWVELMTLIADENSINAFPDGFTSLPKLRSADFSSNDIRTVPAEIARMDVLAMLRLSGNPLRDKKFVSASIEELKDTLAARLSPPSTSMDTYDVGDGTIAEAITSNEASPMGHDFGSSVADSSRQVQEETDTDDFATPPTSAPASPARLRSSSVGTTWEVKPGGMLDRSSSQSSSLHPVACSKLANSHQIREVQLHHNLFSSLPDSLSFFAETLTTLSLAHNQLVGETYLNSGEVLELPALKELNLSSNHITSLTPLVNYLDAPRLEKLDVSVNRIVALPSSKDREGGGRLLRDVFPKLHVVLAGNNHIVELDPESIRGLRTFDATNNDIAHLNPHIGLLGGPGGLQRLDVTGNRFRVPRWNVLERGTEATLRWLRGRVPVAEMAAWKAERGGGSGESASDVD